jgi:hypothetical protein
MFKDKIALAKKIVSLGVGFCVQKAVRNIISNNSETDDDSLSDQAQIVVASYVLGGMAADYSRNFTDARVDDAVALWKKIQTEINKDQP